MRIKLISTFFLTILFSACSMVRQPATSTDVSPVPVASSQAASPVVAASQPDTGPTKSIGTPVPGWENIPIMPGAYDSELEDMVYLYSVQEPMDQVEEYYQTKMSVNGWALKDRQQMATSASSGISTILDFEKNGQLLNIMLVNIPKENATAVILSQLGP